MKNKANDFPVLKPAKIDDAVLALLFLNSFSEKFGVRTWKNFDWDSMHRLHKKGFISNPRSNAKSVLISENGLEKGKELAIKLFGPTG